LAYIGENNAHESLFVVCLLLEVFKKFKCVAKGGDMYVAEQRHIGGDTYIAEHRDT